MLLGTYAKRSLPNIHALVAHIFSQFSMDSIGFVAVAAAFFIP